MVLDEKRKSHVQYDIFNFWNFPKGLGLTVNVGTFSASVLEGQTLFVTQNMIQWATGLTEVGCKLLQYVGSYVKIKNISLSVKTSLLKQDPFIER